MTSAKHNTPSLTELKRVAKAATQTGWGPYDANYPFYAIVKKPAPSLSKHDDERPDMWRIEDAKYLAALSPQTVRRLIQALVDAHAALRESRQAMRDNSNLIAAIENNEQVLASLESSFDWTGV